MEGLSARAASLCFGFNRVRQNRTGIPDFGHRPVAGSQHLPALSDISPMVSISRLDFTRGASSAWPCVQRKIGLD
jgi:hypothetical protein